MDQVFQYYAFISYSHKDEAFAEKLQKRLTFYKLPHLLKQEKPSLPETVKPVFRDKTNLTAGVLNESLRAELDSSKYLIVICSPSSAQSYWVNEEVKHFISIGRKDYIIPVIASGEVNAKDSENECFCPALKGEEQGAEFFGIDVRKSNAHPLAVKLMRFLGIPLKSDTEYQGFIRLVSKLLDLQFDDLWNWQKKEERKRAAFRGIYIVAASILLLIAIVVLWNAKFRTTYRYFADYADKWGIPQGIGELNKTQTAHRQYHYTFEYRAGKLRSVTCANFIERPLASPFDRNPGERPVVQKLEYNDTDGRMERIRFENGYGRTLAIYEYRADMNYSRVNITNDGVLSQNVASTSSFMSAFDSSSSKSDITSYSYERDANGYITRQLFHRYHNASELSCDSSGIFGFKFVVDAQGRQLEKWYLDADGNAFPANKGIAGEIYEYDEKGNQICVQYVDENRALVLGKNLWAVRKVEFDEWGNEVSNSFFGTENEPVLTDGTFKIVSTYNSSGNIIEDRYFDISGNLSEDSSGTAIIRCSYDARGNFTETASYDSADKRTYNIDFQCSKLILVYDKDDRAVEIRPYDENDIPMESAYFSAIFRIKYDKHGNITGRSYFDAEGNPYFNIDGEHSVHIERDEHGRRKEYRCLDADGNLLADNNGVAIYRYGLDERGNEIEMSFLGTDEKPILHKEYNVSLVRWEYDNRGNYIAESYYDIDRNPVLIDGNGFAMQRLEYDDHGNQTVQRNYGTDGKLILDDEGVAIYRYKFDSRGNPTECRFYGINDEPVMSYKYGAGFTSAFDKYGNNTEKYCFDLDDKPVKDADGIAIYRYEYNHRGKVIEESYYGADEKLTLNNNGVAIVRYEYDGRENKTAQNNYGADGEPVLDNEGVATYRNVYNNKGNLIETSHYDKDGNLVCNTNGVAIVRYEYDRMNTLEETLYFDTDGNKVELEEDAE